MNLFGPPDPREGPTLAVDPVCSGSFLLQRSVPEGFGCTWVQHTRMREEANQRSEAERPLQE